MAAALVEMAVRATTVPAGGRRPEPLICILAGEATVERVCELASGVVIHPGLIVPHLDRSQVQTFIFDGADRGHRRLPPTHLPGDAAPGDPSARPALPTPLRLR